MIVFSLQEPHYSDDFDEEDDDDQDYDHDGQNDKRTGSSCYDGDSSDSDDESQASQYVNRRPVSGVTKRPVTGGTFDGKVYPPCVLPRYQRRSTFPLFGAAVITPLTKAVSMPSMTESSTIDKQLPTAVSAGLQPKVISERKRGREPSSSQLLLRKLISQYAMTPLKLIANELITVHYDVYPTELSPNLNRKPSFTGATDEDGGLMSGRCSPKLDIPRRRYCGRMIKQHPLVRFCYRMNDRRLAHLIKKQVSSSSSSSSSSFGPPCHDDDDHHYDSDDDFNGFDEQQKVKKTSKAAKRGVKVKKEEETTTAKQWERVKPIPKENSYLEMFTKKLAKSKPAKKPLPFSKPSGYLEIYKKKFSFSKKKVLPPIDNKQAEDKQPTLVLMPTPPSRPPPVSGTAAAMRSARKIRMEHQQQKNKIPGIGKVQLSLWLYWCSHITISLCLFTEAVIVSGVCGGWSQLCQSWM